MRVSSFVVIFMAALFFSVPILAQTSGNDFATLQLWVDGAREGSDFSQYGRCANDNPRVAIPACTRQLAAQDNRQFRANRRIERAYRYTLRANAYAKQGNLDRALTDYRRAVASYRNLYWIHAYRGDALFAAGQFEDALESYDDAIELAPEESELLAYRARILASAADDDFRDGPQAVENALDAIEMARLSGTPIFYIDTLAMARAEIGQFTNAIELQRRAIANLQAGDTETRTEYQGRLDLYLAEMPYREPVAEY
jgi:tetratricopeptide (TPR) repeat protein